MEVDSCLNVPWRALSDEWVGLIRTRDKVNLTLPGTKSPHSSDKFLTVRILTKVPENLSNFQFRLKKKYPESLGKKRPPKSSSRLMFEWRWWNFTIWALCPSPGTSYLSFAGRTPIKMLDCFRGEQKSSSKLEVFHFSYKLSWTFQIDPQPSPDRDNMPCGLGDSSVLNPVWIQEMWSPYYDFQLRNLETKTETVNFSHRNSLKPSQLWTESSCTSPIEGSAPDFLKGLVEARLHTLQR